MEFLKEEKIIKAYLEATRKTEYQVINTIVDTTIASICMGTTGYVLGSQLGYSVPIALIFSSIPMFVCSYKIDPERLEHKFKHNFEQIQKKKKVS